MGGATRSAEEDLTPGETADVEPDGRWWVRWWLHEALRAVYRQRVVLVMFSRPTRDLSLSVNASTPAVRTVFREGLCVLRSSLPEDESLKWMGLAWKCGEQSGRNRTVCARARAPNRPRA